MKENIPRISASILTYNQEKYISRAIESLLAQKDYLFEIIVSDDCSSDSTWEIVNSYAQNNPGLFKLNRNEHNLGIFEHIEKTWGFFSGDLVYRLAGDDECGAGWLETVCDYIKSNSIDYRNDLICIYGDYEAIYPNGDSFVFSNKAIQQYDDAVSLSFRGIIGNRSCCFSAKIQDFYKKVSKGRSYIAESAIDRQLQAVAKKNFYIPVVGNVYYASIGVNVGLRKGEKLNEREKVESYAKEVIESFGYTFNKKDLEYICYKTEKASAYRKSPIISRVKMMYLYFKSIRFIYSFQFIREIRRMVFAVRRRIPHKKRIRVII